MSEIEGLRKLADEILTLLERKEQDYGTCWRTFGIDGIYAEIGKKFSRIWVNKDKDQRDVNFESLRDTMIDMIAYCLFAIRLIDDNDIDDKIKKILK